MVPHAENQIVEGIAALLHERRDESWAEVAVEIGFADGFSQFRTWCRESYDGDWEPAPRYADLSVEFAESFANLRRLMYRQNRGTWFTARLTVTDQGDYRSDYDFDQQPSFDPPVDPQLFARDLQEFPRDPSRIPAWVPDPA